MNQSPLESIEFISRKIDQYPKLKLNDSCRSSMTREENHQYL
jgi:hypothetical protein